MNDGGKFLLEDDNRGPKDRILVFASEKGKSALSRCSSFFVDGTFKNSSKQFGQLFIIHADHGSSWEETITIPAVYALLPNKKRETYASFFEAVKNNAPGWNPVTRIMDFEIAIVQSAKTLFPQAEIFGCNYHFDQCLWSQYFEMGPLFMMSTTSYILLLGLIIVLLLLLLDTLRFRKQNKSVDNKDTENLALVDPPGPKSWPVIGSLHLLAGYDVPYQAFGVLAKNYGNVFKLHLGSVPCLVVNGLENIKEVLLTKGTHFDGRPNFSRYNQLFCGDKENSLAFCDWSDVQKARREMIRTHTFPRAFSARFHLLNSIATAELDLLVEDLKESHLESIDLRPQLSFAMANIFTSYFCNRRFDKDDSGFMQMVQNFDEIFYEVNQGYAADFIPWLLPFHKKHFSQIEEWSHSIREFMMTEIVASRMDAWTPWKEEEDYVDALINHVRSEQQPAMSLDVAMFALEDIIGGHSALSCFVFKILGFITTLPEVQQRIQEEVDAVTCVGGVNVRPVELGDRTAMPYTEAVALEALRLIASPIVPHVANQDSSISGFKVEKDTLIFLNNYDLHMSPELWSEPEAFKPERFLVNGRLVKPDHFLPFGGGRRSCMGYKMVQFLSFLTLSTLLQHFSLAPVPRVDYRVPVGNLGLPKEVFKFTLQKRR
ncbi:cytochrome P450 307a1-like [Anabrus simplex]|uniref:cytochrome P450 307a1-like n=1 Tax=Anabrus simplex TaxID=316456 RepID=UPI0035A34A37